MKLVHPFSIFFGLIIGLLIAGAVPYFQSSLAQDDKKETMTQEEIDKNLDEILQSQKELLARIETITTQSQFIKATAGK